MLVCRLAYCQPQRRAITIHEDAVISFDRFPHTRRSLRGSGCVVRRSQGFPQTRKKSENLPAEVRASLVFPPASPVVCGPVRKPLASGSISARIAGGL